MSRFCSKQYAHTLIKSFNGKTKQNNLIFVVNIKNIHVETALTLHWPHADHSLKTLNKITKLVQTLYLQQTDLRRTSV